MARPRGSRGVRGWIMTPDVAAAAGVSLAGELSKEDGDKLVKAKMDVKMERSLEPQKRKKQSRKTKTTKNKYGKLSRDEKLAAQSHVIGIKESIKTHGIDKAGMFDPSSNVVPKYKLGQIRQELNWANQQVKRWESRRDDDYGELVYQKGLSMARIFSEALRLAGVKE